MKAFLALLLHRLTTPICVYILDYGNRPANAAVAAELGEFRERLRQDPSYGLRRENVVGDQFVQQRSQHSAARVA